MGDLGGTAAKLGSWDWRLLYMMLHACRPFHYDIGMDTLKLQFAYMLPGPGLILARLRYLDLYYGNSQAAKRPVLLVWMDSPGPSLFTGGSYS